MLHWRFCTTQHNLLNRPLAVLVQTYVEVCVHTPRIAFDLQNVSLRLAVFLDAPQLESELINVRWKHLHT